ncbi:PTS transporter subunit EIIA, partial [Streptococcus agalactiae]|nr:PTS transporter subunit EIIA [Streptococcus agalactiae]
LINRIKKVVPSLDQVEIASLSEMYEKDLTCYDFVLTTIETNLDLPNLYYVSPFIKNEEITQLLTGNPYSNNVTIGKKDQIEANYYIPMLNQDFKTKEELLNSVGQNLVEMGYVQKEFVASLLDREKMGSTEFPLGVALPHGRPEFVLKTVVVFIQNTHKIKWKESLVDTVFLIALSRDDIKNVKDIILKINKTISNEEVLRQLKSETRELEVYKLLNQAD